MPVSMLQGIVIFVFVENCAFSMLGGFFNIYQIFLGTFFIFVFNRVVFDAMGLCDFRVWNLYSDDYMTEQEAETTLLSLLIFLLATSAAWLAYLPHRNHFVRKSRQFYLCPKNSKVADILQIAYYGLIFLSIVKCGIVIYQVRLNGYFWLFNGGIQTFKFPFFLRVQSLTDAVFIALLFYSRNERHVKRNMILYLIYLCIKMLDGQRGAFFVSLLLLLWIYSTHYKRIRVWKLIAIGFLSLMVISFIQTFRSGGYTPFYSVIYGQGVSMLVLTGTIRYMGRFTNKFPFAIGYFVDYFPKLFNSGLRVGQTMEKIINGNYLGDHLMYLISPDQYLNGQGTGTSVVAELYEFAKGNLFIFFVVSFIFMLLILYLSHYFYKNIGCAFVIYFIMYRFIYSPRDSIFKCIDMIALCLPVMILLKMVEQKRPTGVLSPEQENRKDTIISPYQGERTHLAK